MPGRWQMVVGHDVDAPHHSLLAASYRIGRSLSRCWLPPRARLFSFGVLEHVQNGSRTHAAISCPQHASANRLPTACIASTPGCPRWGLTRFAVSSHASRLTPHAARRAPHTSHLTRHTSRLTPHTYFYCCYHLGVAAHPPCPALCDASGHYHRDRRR